MGDYDRKPKEPASPYLRLKSKGDSVRIRIAASPYRELKVWPAEGGEPPLDVVMTGNLSSGQWATLMSDPNFNVNEVFHFLVIDRADGGAKVFTTTGGVYGKVRQFATDAEWGDPKSYDLTITRTEQPGKNYYEVVPSPNKSDLTPAELQKIDGLKVADMLPAALPASSPQPDDFDDNVELEALPWEKPITPAPKAPTEEKKPEKLDEVVPVDDDTEPDLDNIPF